MTILKALITGKNAKDTIENQNNTKMKYGLKWGPFFTFSLSEEGQFSLLPPVSCTAGERLMKIRNYESNFFSSQKEMKHGKQKQQSSQHQICCQNIRYENFFSKLQCQHR